MPYDCTLTSGNRYLLEARINELIELYFDLGRKVLRDFALVLIFEYLEAFVHIDTSEHVYQDDIVKKLDLSEGGLSAVNLLAQVRNSIIHAPQNLEAKLYQDFVDSLSEDAIQDLVGFYLDSELATKFLRSLKEQSRESHIF